ncbi:MAG: hypothetical protein II584_03460 [Treponema sp.]|nr:hypothetical protein [Treponema sp.]MBQ2601431.1 hypothetical protein [Treponema sp.]
MKKFLALAAALVIGSVSAFAYDFSEEDIDIFQINELGTLSSKQFNQIWGDDGEEFVEYIDAAMTERGYSDVDYDVMSEDDFEDIDEEVFEFASAELAQLKAKNGVFVCIVTPDFEDDEEFDDDFFGWVLLANVNKSKVTDMYYYVMDYDTED